MTEQEKLIKLNIQVENLRDRKGKSIQATNDLYSNGFINFKQANIIIRKIQNKYLKERLEIEKERRL